MKYCARTHVSMLLVLILHLIDPMGATSCPSYCGNISIPYPFGIGKGCYINEWFEIQCNNSTSGKLVPYLPKINKEVVRIYLPEPEDATSFYPYGSLLIKTNITSTGCSSSSSDGRMVGEVLNFTNSPFTIGASNVLVAVGCNNKATLTNLEPKLAGCMSSCGPRKKGDQSNCNGYRCCQADTPVTQDQKNSYSRGLPSDLNDGILEFTTADVGMKIIGVSIEDITNQTRSCKVAFLTDEFVRYPPVYPTNKLTDPQWFYNRKYVTVQLRWVIHNMNRSFIKSLGCEPRVYPGRIKNSKRGITCQCKRIYMDDSVESLSGSCQCSSGYRGNPYLPGGCKDVNECQKLTSDGKSDYCSESETCVNTQGSFRCVSKRIKILKITIGFSAGFGVLIFIGISFWLFKFIKRQKEINRKKKFFKRNGGLLLQQHLTSREGNIEKTKVFTSKELEKATENFSLTRVLGQGGQGTVYKGMLVDGRIVAVKKSKVVDEDKLEEFINEVVILSQINHRHIVKLLGCCLETEVPLLVYEFIPNGNLFEHLHDDSDDYTMATWEVRLRTALDIAEAVSYLHSAAASPIYHRDIKTTNIMLDEKYRGKVSDFGTSRTVTVDHTHLTTVVSSSEFSSYHTWNLIRDSQAKVGWSKMVWFSQRTPKFAFIFWLACWNRLSTMDRVLVWNPMATATCILCSSLIESREHLFFECSFSRSVWLAVIGRLMGSSPPHEWSRIHDYIHSTRLDKVTKFLLKYAFQAVVYAIWTERNNRRHGQLPVGQEVLQKLIDKGIRNKISSMKEHGLLWINGGLQIWFSR